MAISHNSDSFITPLRYANLTNYAPMTLKTRPKVSSGRPPSEISILYII